MKDEEIWIEVSRRETTGGTRITYKNLKTGVIETKYYPVNFRDSNTSKE